MLGIMVKSFYAERTATALENMFMVSVMPRTAKKYEVQRPEMGVDGNHDVDVILTIGELVRMARMVGIDLVNLPEDEFDASLGLGTGAADIFGVAGGVMEATLHAVYEVVAGKEPPFDKLYMASIVGLEQVKTVSITIEDMLPAYEHLKGVTVNMVVTSGLEGVSTLMGEMAAGASPYHSIEVIGCLGGYMNGDG